MSIVSHSYDRAGALHEFCIHLWDVRDALKNEATFMARGLALATAQDVLHKPHYDPSRDRRILWAREVIEAMHAKKRRPRACGDLEHLVAWLIDALPTECGKSRAAQN
jgi:uncharacterized membrane-anchored protein